MAGWDWVLLSGSVVLLCRVAVSELSGAVTQAAVNFAKQSQGRGVFRSSCGVGESWGRGEFCEASGGRELCIVLQGGRGHALEARLGLMGPNCAQFCALWASSTSS